MIIGRRLFHLAVAGFLGLWSPSAVPAQATVRYVNDDSPCNPVCNGGTWETAYQSV